MAKSKKVKLHQWYHQDTSKHYEKWQRIHHWYHFARKEGYLYSLIYIWQKNPQYRELMTSHITEVIFSSGAMLSDNPIVAINHPGVSVRQKDKNSLIRRMFKLGRWDTNR